MMKMKKKEKIKDEKKKVTITKTHKIILGMFLLVVCVVLGKINYHYINDEEVEVVVSMINEQYKK